MVLSYIACAGTFNGLNLVILRGGNKEAGNLDQQMSKRISQAPSTTRLSPDLITKESRTRVVLRNPRGFSHVTDIENINYQYQYDEDSEMCMYGTAAALL